jgi:2-hydroxycyclohexanecarboxyl-CoA dehydrogenase
MQLDGKIALVTGGASGIGRAACEALAAAGALVYIADINQAAAEESAAAIVRSGKQARSVPLDVTDEKSIAAAANLLRESHGKLDVFVSAAGWDIIQPFMENTPDYWERIVALNFLGPVRVTRSLLPLLIEARESRIVTVGSDAGRVGSSGESVYAGAKGGVIAFTKSLAREVVRYGINVNCVCPGPTDTPLFATHGEKMREALIRAIPMRRLAKPSEIADAILFFASSRSSFITGQVLSVSGGLTMAG